MDSAVPASVISLAVMVIGATIVVDSADPASVISLALIVTEVAIVADTADEETVSVVKMTVGTYISPKTRLDH
jgi:hypothetical protein